MLDATPHYAMPQAGFALDPHGQPPDPPEPPAAGEILSVDEESLPLSPSYEKAQNFSALLASLSEPLRQQMGHDKQDFIQECTFNGRICTPEEDFVTILDETYGNCFIFNSGRTRGGAFWTVKQPGPLHGLQLTLFLDPDEYLSDLTPAAGARLLIHEHTQYPFAGEEGISLPPGYTVSIGLTQVRNNTTQHNTTQRNTTQHNTTQHSTTQHNTARQRLLIHEHTQYPFAGEEGISLPPGYTVSIGLTQTLLERKGGKYGPCTDGKDKGFYRLKNGTHVRLFPETYSYSVKLCEKTCLQQQIVERCGCADPYIRIPDNEVPCHPRVGRCGCADPYIRIPDNEVPCHPRDQCRTDFKKLYLNGSLQCDCPEACRETVFSSTVGFGEWPAPRYAETFIDDMKTRHGTGFGNLGTAAEIREGFIQVTVYFENMKIEHIYETPSYEVENLLGDIGGQLGLWMGISIMTVIELAEFLTDVVIFLTMRRKKAEQLSPPDVESDLPRDPAPGLPAGPYIVMPRQFPLAEVVPNRSRIVPRYPIMKGSWRNATFTEV
ncbi:degenerin mec-4-like [Branchiostoma floridae x Branchiostoma japonicum]